MKITAFFHGILYKDQIVLRVTDKKDLLLVKKLFESKKNREERSCKEILLNCQIDAAFQKRSFKQLSSVWKLVTVIFESMENRKPTEEEKYDLYLDLLDVYADKIPSKINNNALRAVRISESNTASAARFIEGLLYHLATECNLSVDLQADVRQVLYEWEIWKGKKNHDINSHLTISEWRKKAVYSQASGRCEQIEIAHIVSRGSAPQFENEIWNVIALTRDEHSFMHSHGWGIFLEKYPHLKGRVERAFELAGHLPIPRINEKSENMNVSDLARLALL
ncbi:MAG: hypothetical protein ACRC4W_02260 [Treponemataceae bacterium]